MKILAITLGVVLIVAIAALLLRIALEPGGETEEEIVDLEMNKLRSAVHGNFAVVVGTYRDGKVWMKGYGSVSESDPSAPTSATVFQIGSITKVFTASLLQVLSGRDGISEALTIKEILGPSFELSEWSSDLTLGQLGTHTAGFPRVPKFLERDLPRALDEKEMMKDPYSYIRPETVFEYLEAPLDKDKAPPGRFEYSNYGMGLLGHLLARATGQGYEQLLKREILEPLEMRDTAVSPSASMLARLAQGHTADGQPAAPWHFSALEGAGALLSTADDIMRFARANLEGGLPISTQLHAMHAARASGKTGLGWLQPTFFDKLLGNKELVWHDGGTLGYSSYLSVDRKAGNAVVILSANGMNLSFPGMLLSRKLRRLKVVAQQVTQP